jgi:hypothetical protein
MNQYILKLATLKIDSNHYAFAQVVEEIICATLPSIIYEVYLSGNRWNSMTTLLLTENFSKE